MKRNNYITDPEPIDPEYGEELPLFTIEVPPRDRSFYVERKEVGEADAAEGDV